jgi:CheY-like chemotaxis protein
VDETQGKGLTEAVGQLLAILAHEIRNPLSNLNNSVALLEREPQDVNLVLNCAQIMKRQVGRIAHLVDDLFEMSVIDQGKMNLSKTAISVNHLMQLAVDDSTCEMEVKNHNLNMSLLPEDVKVSGDLTRLIQVLCNLLGNAAKYTPNEGRIRFSGRVEEDNVILSIDDDGIGIEPRALESIFDLFSPEMRAAGKTGLGLGLALVKKLVELHDGHVSAYSEGPGKGSRFEVRLPIHHDSGSETDLPTEGKRVLLVEDNKDSAHSLKTIIELEGGHEVRTSGSGQEAIQDALCFDPEIVLLDLGLPGMSGEIVARILRKRLPKACIVALTGYSQPETNDGWFDHFITKPLNFPHLFRILSACHVVAA